MSTFTTEERKRLQQQPSTPAPTSEMPQLNPNLTKPYTMAADLPTYEQITAPKFKGARDALTYKDKLALDKASANLDYAQAQAQAKQAQEDLSALINKHGSARAAAVEMMNPKKQEKFSADNVDREKRRAIATSLGNLFSAIAGGAMAASGVGLGYVPQATPNKSLAKLSDLEKAYLKAGEEYQSALGKLRVSETEREVAQAQARVKSMEATAKSRKKSVEDIEKRLDKIEEAQAKENIKQKGRESLAVFNANLKKEANKSTSARKQSERDREYERKKDYDDHVTENNIREAKEKPQKGSSSKPSSTPFADRVSGSSGTQQNEPVKPSKVVTTAAPKKKKKEGVAAAGLDIES